MQKFEEKENTAMGSKQEIEKNIIPQQIVPQKENKAEPMSLEKKKAFGHTTIKTEEEPEKEHIKMI